MKVYTSYFYQIRNMEPWQIPLSTAASDPMWYKPIVGTSFKDKRGVINGLRCVPFVPNKHAVKLCRGLEKCATGDPETCAFLAEYRKQLDQLDFSEIMSRFERLSAQIKEREQINHEIEMVLLVYEAPANKCSERSVIQDWFHSHGYPIEELQFQKKEKVAPAKGEYRF